MASFFRSPEERLRELKFKLAMNIRTLDRDLKKSHEKIQAGYRRIQKFSTSGQSELMNLEARTIAIDDAYHAKLTNLYTSAKLLLNEADVAEGQYRLVGSMKDITKVASVLASRNPIEDTLKKMQLFVDSVAVAKESESAISTNIDPENDLDSRAKRLVDVAASFNSTKAPPLAYQSAEAMRELQTLKEAVAEMDRV